MFVNFEYVYDLSLITHSYYNYYYYFILFCFALFYFLSYFISALKLLFSQPMGFTFFFSELSSPSHLGSVWASNCIVFSCHLGLNHDSHKPSSFVFVSHFQPKQTTLRKQMRKKKHIKNLIALIKYLQTELRHLIWGFYHWEIWKLITRQSWMLLVIQKEKCILYCFTSLKT